MQAYRVDLDTKLLSTLIRSSSLPQRFSLTGQLARPVFDGVLVAPGKEFLLRMNPVSTPAPLTLYLGVVSRRIPWSQGRSRAPNRCSGASTSATR